MQMRLDRAIPMQADVAYQAQPQAQVSAPRGIAQARTGSSQQTAFQPQQLAPVSSLQARVRPCLRVFYQQRGSFTIICHDNLLADL